MRNPGMRLGDLRESFGFQRFVPLDGAESGAGGSKLGPHFSQLTPFDDGQTVPSAIGDGRFASAAFAGKPADGTITILGDRLDAAFKSGGAFSAAVGGPGVAGAISAPPSSIAVDGSIDVSGEIDTYTLAVTAGETYMLSLFASGGTPLPDTLVYVYDSSGVTIVKTDDDGGAGLNSLLTFTATYTGDYVIGAAGFGSSTGGYTLDTILQPPADTVPDTLAGAAPLTVDGVTYGFIDSASPGPYGATFGEVDTYSIAVEAGKVYTIEVAGGADYSSDYTMLPAGELDAYIALYDAGGSLVAQNDDISFPSDVSSSLTFVAAYDGTYYLDIFSYAPWTGGFSVTVDEIDTSGFDPLESIIWDSAGNVTFDGSNVAYVYFAAAGENFGELADDGVSPLPSFGWNPWEQQQIMLALDEYEKILGVDYQITTDVNQATFRLITTTSTEYGAYFYPQDPAYGTQQGIGVFNVDSGAWNFDIQQQSLTRGGYAFAVMLHEFGHAHGLSHPHDNGGGSDIMLGVAGFDALGLFDLNQGVYTVMSYNDAWETHPAGPSPYDAANYDNGWSGGLGAFDIAALQQRYGVNNPSATGDDIYVLSDLNDAGTFYRAIWDTGGADSIEYAGAFDARIDLLAATLDYTPTGGGVLSYVEGIWGGYTIANGVVIENAAGGTGNDTLLGNAAANVLQGNGGADVLMGREHADRLFGGPGPDTLHGDGGADTLKGRGGADSFNGGAGIDTADYTDAAAAVTVSLSSGTGAGDVAEGDALAAIEHLIGGGFDDSLTGADVISNILSGGAGADTLQGLSGNDSLIGESGVDLLHGGAESDTLQGGDDDDILLGGAGFDSMLGEAGNDMMRGGSVADTIYGGDGDDYMAGQGGLDRLLGEAGADTVQGNTGRDSIDGGDGDDVLAGRAGADTLAGGDGNDLLTGKGGADVYEFSAGGDADTIRSFAAGDGDGDVIRLIGFAAAFDDFADVLAAASDDGASTTIDLGGGDRLILRGVLVADLAADDFTFG